MAIVVKVLAYLTLLTQISIMGLFFWMAYNRLSGSKLEDRLEFLQWKRDTLERYYRELSLLFATVATLGSLYMSNILGWEPCRLCWFQRIFMYPLVLIIPVAIMFDRDDVHEYVLPLAMVGITFSAIHYPIQRFEQFTSAGCSVFSISCSTNYTFYFGYITVPVMAFTAFLAVIVLMWKFR